MARPDPFDPPPDPTPVTYYTTLTVVTGGAHGRSVGDFITISGATLYNGTYQVSTVINSTTLKVSYVSYDATVGTGGNLTPQAPSLVRVNNTVTATTSTAHGYYPGLRVSVSGFTDLTVGGSISAIARVNNVVTVTTASAHGLTAGLSVTVTGVTDTAFNGTFTVQSIISGTQFTYDQQLADATSSSGSVKFPWNGTFYIASVPTSTTFTYSQTGPSGNVATSGTATPLGQVTAGAHNAVVIFKTRQGYLTTPSPPVTFYADGSKHVVCTNLPIGPSNVVARIVAFTTANGGNYFYIPVPAEVGGQQVSSSTVVNDNTSTSAMFDFSDVTLAAATAIDISGNNLFSQVVLGPCLGFFNYAGRLMAWGEYNKVQKFLNMGFEGGYNVLTQPLGWTLVGTGGTLVTDGDVGMAWKVTQSGFDNGMITQLAYQDAYGSPILREDTLYKFRLWAKTTATQGLIVAEIYDFNSSTLLSQASIPLTSVAPYGSFIEAEFDHRTPSSIPVGAILRVYVTSMNAGATTTIDELEIVYAENPYLKTFHCSYVDNPEAFDGLTGVLGAASDNTEIVFPEELRDAMYFVTQGKLHQTRDLTDTEPSNWTVAEMASEVGGISFRGHTSGEDWFMWATDSGARIFDGGHPYKVSQEIQTLWDAINPSRQHWVWAKNDAGKRRVYFGVPTDSYQTPNQIYVLDYREIDTAGNIATSSSVRTGFSGRLINTDIARKWTKWNVYANCGDFLTNADGSREMYFSGGNGQALGSGSGFGNVYRLNGQKYTDDDYGAINSYYTTFFFINHDAELQTGVGSHRKLYTYLAMLISGVGKVAVVPYVNNLSNAWDATPSYPLSSSPDFDYEWGLNVLGERTAFRIHALPIVDPTEAGYTNGTDNAFNTGKMIVSMRQEPMAPVRGVL